MRSWQLSGLVVAAAALLFTAAPAAQAQVWVRPAPVVVAPSPVWVAQSPVVVGPGWGGPVWGAGPAWGVRTYYRPIRRGWYGTGWGPRGRRAAWARGWW
jgi:hypothetical protein